MLIALISILTALAALLDHVAAQEGVRDDSHVENVVRQAVADEFSSEILTNRTRAYLSCATGEMVVKLNFSEPFRGVTYTNYDRTSPCRFYGDGSKYYELRIPLKGCGTKQEAPRVFINNIIVRFHRSLELEEDEIKTIICRYPPPLAPPPSAVAPVLLPTPVAPVIVPPKLSEVELLLIICALLFLTLLLLGIGIAYYCLKKRNIKVIKKKKAISSGPGSEITKISGSTMGTLSMFDPIRIPRAMAQSTSGSVSPLLTSVSGSGETIPSDYPSESPSSLSSDVEEIDVAQVPVPQMLKPVPVPKKAHIASQQILASVSEREDALMAREALQKTYAALRSVPSEMHPPVRYSRVNVEEYAPSLQGSIPDNDIWSHSELESQVAQMPYRPPPRREILTVSDAYLSEQQRTEVEDEIQKTATDISQALVRKKPKITIQNIDDLYLTTTTEVHATETVTKTTRDTLQQHVKKPQWDVTIRHYQQEEDEATFTNLLYKVLEPPPTVEGIELLTPTIKEKWRTVLTTDETFRHLVQEATTVEEYIRITKDARYERLFDTRTWNVIIRVLSCQDARTRYKKKTEEMARSRRSSLPPVTEMSLAREAPPPPSSCGSVRSRRTSGSMYDLRSMTEVDVDFAHADRESLWSVDTGYTYKTSRSLAERSTSEFLEDVPTIVAGESFRGGSYQQSSSYMRESHFGDSHFGESHFGEDVTRRERRSMPPGRFLERSSTEYFEDVPTMEIPESAMRVSAVTERRMDNVFHELRQNGKFSRSEIIIDSPIVRAIDRASSIGEREEIKSITETDVLDWKR